MLKVYSLISFGMFISPETVTPVEVMNISVTLKSFLVILVVPPSHSPSLYLPFPRQALICFLSLYVSLHFLRKWQPTPVFLPGESQGWGSLVGCRLWGCTESDTTEAT